MQLSLIVVYRNREHHLKSKMAWWKWQKSNNCLSNCEMIVIEADRSPSLWIQEELDGTDVQYQYLQCEGVLHKTKALNLGLSLSQGQFVAPFDVDLIPVNQTLEKHLHLAATSPSLLVTGYRVMSEVEKVSPDSISQALENASIPPEDRPTALWKHLIQRERFGIMPLFNRERLVSLGGWDEIFVGWGAEDQELLERYLQDDLFLTRCLDLVYLHLFHQPEANWYEAPLIEKNRTHYYRQRLARQKSGTLGDSATP